MFFMMFVEVYVLVLILTAVAVGIEEGDHCITPNAEKATCTALTKCSLILNALTSGDPNQFLFYKLSQCGPSGGLVCCGTLGYQINKTQNSETKISSRPVPFVVLSDFSDSSICGLEIQSSKRIKGGTVATFEEFPWLVALEYYSTFRKEDAGIRCAGSLISDKFVLTAAHCIIHVEFVITKAWLGVTNISSDANCLNLYNEIQCLNSTQKIKVEAARPHPKYNSFSESNDIGLLQLEHSIKFTNYIRPICLPLVSAERIGIYMTVAGWGTTEKRDRSDIKLKVQVPVQNSSVCNKFLENDMRKLEPRVQLCAGGEKGKDSCQGDSGGPLVKDFMNENERIQWYQEAIVSYGVGCGIEGHPGIYTRVYPYIDWITKIAKIETYTEQGNLCKTPNGKDGKCVPLNTCKTVFNAASSKNRTLQGFAKNSHCGYGDVILVCCETPGAVIIPNFGTNALPNRTVCGVLKENPKIIDGKVVDHSAFPWAVGIEYKDLENGESVGIQCVGSLINSRYVLTKAVCLLLQNWKPFMVWLGDLSASSNSHCGDHKLSCENQVQKIPIKETIPNVFFKFATDYNIGLILLENQIQFTDYILPVCLPYPDLPPPELGTHMTVIVWNYTKYDAIMFNDSAKLELSLITNEKCKVYPWLLCTENIGTCDDVIVGPLTRPYQDKLTKRIQWYQDTLVSYCDDQGKITVHTEISAYMDWIIKVISED